MSKTWVLALVLAASCSLGAAQLQAQANRTPSRTNTNDSAFQHRSEAPETATCAYQFTSGGSGTTPFMQYCATVNGNIVEFQSPSGIEHIARGIIGEGYGICDFGTGPPFGRYFDWADSGDSSNWQASILLSNTATTVKIARTTSDGIWTLTQTITQNAKGGYVTVGMALKNNSGLNRSAYIIRWADADADNTVINNLDASVNSAWAYTRLGHGLLLQVAGAPAPNIPAAGYPLNTAFGPDPCNPIAAYAGTLTDADGSIELWYLTENNIGPGKTVTVKVKYSSL